MCNCNTKGTGNMDKLQRTYMLKRSFGAIYRQGSIIDNSRVKHWHISGAQARYMEIIGDHPGISQEAIARMECVDKGAVARAIKKLEVEHYVVRKRNKQDYRAWCLFLTERGEEVYLGREKNCKDMEALMFKGFTDEEIDTLVELMDRVTKNIEDMRCMKEGSEK